MLHYFILLAYILVICIIPIKNNKVKLLFCFVPFALFFGSRVGWTPDYFNYEELFYTIHDNKFYSLESSITEIGFELLCKILPTYRSLIWVITILYTVSLFLIFDKYIVCKYWFIAFILLFINHQLLLGTISAMRSSVVASLFIFTIHARLKKIKFIHFLLLFIACLFHRSGIVLFVFLVLEHYKNSRVLKKILITIIFVLLIISFTDSTLLGSKLVKILESSNTFERYTYYISMSKHSFFFYIYVILNIFLIVTNIFLLNNSRNYIIWLIISIVFFTLLSLPNIGMISRFTSYLGPAVLVGLSAWDEVGRKYQLLKYIYIGIFLSSTLYFFLFSFTQYSGFYLYRNYNSIFFQ